MTSRQRCRELKRKATIAHHLESLVSVWIKRTTTAVGSVTTRVASTHCNFCTRMDYMRSHRLALTLDDSHLLSLLSLIFMSPFFSYFPTSLSFLSSTSSFMRERYKSEAKNKKKHAVFFLGLKKTISKFGLYAPKLHLSYPKWRALKWRAADYVRPVSNI